MAERIDPLLVEEEGHVALVLGNEAIVRGALEAGVGFASGYPGTPSSEVTDSFARISKQRDLCFEYSVNEKIALEMAYAACLGGARSICAMKHLGLLVAGDPLSTMAYMGVRAGLVIVSAGDPSCHTSPNEQDQRYLGQMLHVPVLDPSTPEEALRMTRMAFDLSEESLQPVLMRITARVAHCRAPVKFGRLMPPPTATGFERDPKRFVPIPPHARVLRQQIPERLEIARGFSEKLFRREGGCPSGQRQAVVATGSPAATCRDLIAKHGLHDRVIFAEVGGVYPLPEQSLVALLKEVDRVLVVEELSPFVEDALHGLCGRHHIDCTVLGKRSGHLPEPFEYTVDIIEGGLRDALEVIGSPSTVVPVEDASPARPAVLCSGCPHRATYFAAKAAFGDEQLYFNDIGCYTLGFAPPLQTADALICMGAGFTLAAGVSRVTGERTVGFMGDGTFFHAGMPALLNCVKEDANMVAVILDNQVVAMTGFQESPTVSIDAPSPARSVSIEGVVRALGVEHVETIDPERLPTAIAAFERARDHQGLYVIIAEHPCPVHMARVHGVPEDASTFAIDPSRCQTCARDSCGLRCDQGVTPGLERHMAKSRALEMLVEPGGDRGPGQASGAAPCGTQCPLALCIQGYTGHIASGQYEHALELIMSRNPLPDSVCRVCHRPCESVCVRAQVDESVAINDLKRFVVDWAAGEPGRAYQPKCEESHGRRVAVVGAGPAGLAAAHDLSLRGYEVTLYDRADAPGGLLRSGVPAFRLPPEALDRDVARIMGLGVRFEGGQALGRELRVRGLLEAGWDAVFLAVGAGRSIPLEWGEGQGALRVEGAIEYLARARANGAAPTGKRVLVIGGGNAALDAARTAVRCGAKHVVVACREGRGDMPALADEVLGALDEGVELRTDLSPRLDVRPDGGVAFFQVIAHHDDPQTHAFDPAPEPDVHIEADHVIVAIGQAPETDVLEADVDLERARDGSIVIDTDTMQTSHPNVFAGGDAVGGRRSVTNSIADGQRAAWGIDQQLRGLELADQKVPPPHLEPAPSPEDQRPAVTRIDGRPRARPTELSTTERAASFAEVASTFSEKQARAEAARCMVCGQCGNCRACIDLFGCPAFHLAACEVGGSGIAIDPEICTGCGECADFCPNHAIYRVGPGTGEVTS